jgi:hypothetical protein
MEHKCNIVTRPLVPVQKMGFQHRLNTELDLKSLFEFHVHSCTYSIAKPPPRIWAHIRGRYWSAKIDDRSLCDPLVSEIPTLPQSLYYTFEP